MPTLTTTTLGRFCRELAGGLDSIPVLLTEWQISQQDFEDIQTSPAFLQEMAIVQQEMRDLGNDAGYIYRMKSLSESMLPEIVALLKDPAMGAMGKFEIIKWIAEMARLKEKPVPKGEFSGPRGPTVVFRFGEGLPIKSMTVHAGEAEPIEVQPQRVIEAAVIDNSGWPA